MFFVGASALKCIRCSGDGQSCRDKGKSKQCPGTTNSTGEGLCGRVNYMVNGTNEVVERCALKQVCVGTIDCKKDKFEFAKRYPGATNCVVSCCQGDNCNPQPALQCYVCKGKGKTCSQSSVSCGYGDDRCIRINFKVNETEMVDERCYQSSRCANKTEICDLVRGDYPSANNCQSLCCQGDHCNDDVGNKCCTLEVPLIDIIPSILMLVSFYY